MQQLNEQEFCEAAVHEIFSGLAFGIDAETWMTGRTIFVNENEPARAINKFALAHYLFFGDPTRSLPALGYGSETEREWVISHVLFQRRVNTDESAAKTSARTWRKRAGECVPISLDSVSTEQLKGCIAACLAYAVTAPSAEDANKLSLLIEQIRQELTKRITGPKRKNSPR